MRSSADDRDDRYRKILFRLERDEHGYPPDEWETLWARELGSGLYQIDSVPFYVMGVSWQDVVRAESHDGELRFAGLVRPSRHSVLRVIVFDDDTLPRLTRTLTDFGCSFEVSHIPSFLAVDVPPDVDYSRLSAFLDVGEADHRWEYQEGSLRHD